MTPREPSTNSGIESLVDDALHQGGGRGVRSQRELCHLGDVARRRRGSAR
jgi:hypothetical protein